jgi:hypothetical protein
MILPGCEVFFANRELLTAGAKSVLVALVMGSKRQKVKLEVSLLL